MGRVATFCAPCRAVRKREASARTLEKLRAEWAGAAKPAGWAIPASTVGAMNELLVASDLLRRGYEVYRAMSPAASCDLLVLRDGVLAGRVEVRTTRRDSTGVLQRRVTTADRGRFDVLALVEPNGAIHYRGLDGV